MHRRGGTFWHLCLIVVLSMIVGAGVTQLWRVAVDTVPGCDSAQHDAAMISLATARAQLTTIDWKQGRPPLQALQRAESELLEMCAPAANFGGSD